MTDKLKETINNVVNSAYSKGYHSGYRAAVLDFARRYREEADKLEKVIQEQDEAENDNIRKD